MTTKAGALYDEGFVAFKALKFTEARASFLAAWALSKHWQIAASLAAVEWKLEMYRDAATHYAFFFRHAPPEERANADAHRKFDDAKRYIATVVVTAEARDPVLFLDGTILGQGLPDDPIFMDPGKHELVARLGAKTANIKLDVKAGDRREIALSFDGSSTVSGGGSDGTTGSHAGPGWPWVIGAGVAGVVGVGVGAGLTVAANAKASDAAAAQGGSSSCAGGVVSARCSMLASAATSKTELSNGAVGAFVAGGVFVVAAVGLGVWQAKGSQEAKVGFRVAPFVSPQASGVSLAGSF